MKPMYLIALMLLIALLFAAWQAEAEVYDARVIGHISAGVVGMATAAMLPDGTLVVDIPRSEPFGGTAMDVVHTTDGVFINF